MAIQFLNNVNADNGVLYVDAVNDRVGIGTTSPTEKLTIEGTSTPTIEITDTSTPVTLHVSSANARANIGTTTSHPLRVLTNDTERMRINSDGNVGIGTTSPQKLLDIENGGFNMFAIGGTSADTFSVVTHSYLFSDENEDAAYSYGNNEHEFSTQGMPRVTIDSTGLVGIGTTGPGSLLHVSGGELDVSGGDGYKIEDNPWAYWASDLLTLGDWDGVGYSTRIMGSNSSEVMRVTGNNVGIGTTSPTEKLEVAGAIKMSENSSYPLTIDHNSATTTNEITTVGGLNIISGSNNSINFKDATTTNMSISGYSGDVLMGYNTGKVGIGTTSPTDKLTVKNGNIRLNSTSSYPAQGLYAYWNSSSPNMGGISWHNNPGFIGSEWNHYKQSSPYTQSRIRLIGDANGGMYVNLNNSDVFSILASNGGVGIANTNPTGLLVVGAGTSNTGHRSNTLLSEEATGSTANSLGLVNSALGAYGNETALNFHLSRTYSPTARIIAYQDGGSSQTDTGLKFFTYNGSLQQRMTIDHDGNVGIGVTNPTSKLHIDGTVLASSTMTASNFILSSDKKLKENIKDLNSKPLNVKWRKFELKSEPGIHRVGVIAQELEKTNPEFVREDKDGLKSVAYIDLLINKIAELEARLEKAGL